MDVLILALRTSIIKTKFAYYLFFLAKWLSPSFDLTILRKKSGGEGLVTLRFCGYLKRQLELLVLQTFLLVKI